MLSFAFIVAAMIYPAFDADRAAQLCAAKRNDEVWALVYATDDACVADQLADYRRFTIIADAANAAMAMSFNNCLSTWTKGGQSDWGMVRLCAVANVDGKRDVGLLRAVVPRTVRPAIDKCIADAGEGGAPDWDDVVSCARDQASAARDFELARAAARTDGDRRLIARCAASTPKDPIVDWENVLSCALGGGDAKADDDIIIT